MRQEAMPSLTQMVDDDFHATVMPHQDAAGLKRLTNHMLQMRVSLERYLGQLLMQHQQTPRSMLLDKIRQFASLKTHPKNVSVRDFCDAMHTLRVYGNRAAHNQLALPSYEECLAAVSKYKELKVDYEKHRGKV